jgi:hypothetical protein
MTAVHATLHVAGKPTVPVAVHAAAGVTGGMARAEADDDDDVPPAAPCRASSKPKRLNDPWAAQMEGQVADLKRPHPYAETVDR